MPFVYALPGWAAMLLIVSFCVAAAVAGHVAVHRSFAKTDFIEHNEVAGFVVAVVGVMYAVLLGFITVVVWEHYAQAEERAQAEVDAATDVWRFGKLLPAADATRLRDDVDRYAVIVGADEWPKMRTGHSSAAAQQAVLNLIGDVAKAPADTPARSNLQNRLFDRVGVVADLRRHRIYDLGTTVLPVIKLGLVLGAIVLVGFLYLFGMRNFNVQLLMTAATSATIGILFSLIVLLDYPFRGDVSVSPERWFDLHERIVAEREATGTGTR